MQLPRPPRSLTRRGRIVGLLGIAALAVVAATAIGVFSMRPTSETADPSSEPPAVSQPTDTEENIPTGPTTYAADDFGYLESRGVAETETQLPPLVNQPGTGDRAIVRNGTITVTLDPEAGPLDDAIDDLRTGVAGVGGYIASESRSSSESSGTRVTVTLRVPADQFTEFVSQVEGYGTVESSETSTDDVSGTLLDLDARLRTLQAEADALRGLLANATSLADILSIREQLATTQSQIESYAAQKAALEDQVSLATLTVTLQDPDAVPVGTDGDESYWSEVWQTTTHRIEQIAGAFLVGAVTLAPFVLLTLLGWVAWRYGMRRRNAPSTEHLAETPST